MSNAERLVASIVQFLGDQLRSDTLSTDAKESLEVAVQCLESAYNISSSDVHLLVSKSLLDIFKEATKDEPLTKDSPATEEAKREAETLKTEGNNLMKLEKFEEALKCYTRAIQLDSKNAVYFCNRAAAYSKLNNHSFALEDCHRAIEIDPNYSKAYGRMGLAFASLNDHFRAKDCYKKAVELDPENESYRNNLKIAEDKVAELERHPGFGGGPFDFGSILSNPDVMNMATQFMRDPNLQNMYEKATAFLNYYSASSVSNLVSSISGIISGGLSGEGNSAPPPPQPTGGDANASGGGAGGGFEAFLRAGQQLAAQMQATNPELVEQLRRQMGNNPQSQNNGNSNRNNNSGGSA